MVEFLELLELWDVNKKLELGFMVKNYIIIMLYNYSLSNYYNNIVIIIDIINI